MNILNSLGYIIFILMVVVLLGHGLAALPKHYWKQRDQRDVLKELQWQAYQCSERKK